MVYTCQAGDPIQPSLFIDILYCGIDGTAGTAIEIAKPALVPIKK